MSAEPELVLFPEDDTPYDPVGSITVPARDLLRALVAVVHAASTDDDRPILASVAIQPREAADAVRLVATDNYRIAMCEVDADLDDAGDWRGRVPAALEDVKRLIVVLKSIPDVKADTCSTRVVLTLGRQNLGSEVDGPRRLDAFVDDDTPIARLPLRVIDGIYPDVGLVIPRDAEHVGAFTGKYLAEAARFAGEFGTAGIVLQSRSDKGATGPFVFRSDRFTEIVMPVKTGEDLGRQVAEAMVDAAESDADITAPLRELAESMGTDITIEAHGRTATIHGRKVDTDTGEILPSSDVDAWTPSPAPCVRDGEHCATHNAPWPNEAKACWAVPR